MNSKSNRFKRSQLTFKRSQLMIALGLVVILLLSACGNSNSDSNTIRLGLVCGSLNPFLAVAAVDDGTFEKHGITVEENCFSSGSDAVQALIGGSIDVNLGSYEHVLRQRVNGLEVKAYGALYNGVGYSLIVKSDSEYNDVAELKGETIGVTRTGSLSDTGLRLILGDAGLDPERDVTIIGAGSGATMLASLESNQVAGGMVNEPTGAKMIASGDYRVMVDPDFDYVGIVAMAKEEWVEKNKDAMQSFLDALKDVHKDANEDPRRLAEVISPDYEQVEIDVLEAAIISELRKMPADLIVSPTGAQGVVDSQIELNAISEQVPFEETVDMSFLQ